EAARPLRPYGGARAGSFATVQLHHPVGHDLRRCRTLGSSREDEGAAGGQIQGDLHGRHGRIVNRSAVAL
ncbi:MAG: hypothetical protein ACK52I_19415, partial [Pseudomonadota bacterium]